MTKIFAIHLNQMIIFQVQTDRSWTSDIWYQYTARYRVSYQISDRISIQMLNLTSGPVPDNKKINLFHSSISSKKRCSINISPLTQSLSQWSCFYYFSILTFMARSRDSLQMSSKIFFLYWKNKSTCKKAESHKYYLLSKDKNG